MIVVRVRGGIGNQLFQYAFGRAISSKMHAKVFFHVMPTCREIKREYLLGELNDPDLSVTNSDDLDSFTRCILNPVINKALRMAHIDTVPVKNGLYYFDYNKSYNSEMMNHLGDNLYFDGYFQSYKYFEHIRDCLLESICLPSVNSSRTGWISEVTGKESVSVHVRRGDFVQSRDGKHYLLEKQYYDKAIDIVRRGLEEPVFYWFSDDKEWLKANIPTDEYNRIVSVESEHPELDELMVMKSCKHGITANSSFSWWGAWLQENSDGIRIAPKTHMQNKDMIPEQWIGI